MRRFSSIIFISLNGLLRVTASNLAKNHQENTFAYNGSPRLCNVLSQKKANQMLMSDFVCTYKMGKTAIRLLKHITD